MGLPPLTYFIDDEGLPFTSTCHRHTSRLVFIEPRYVHHHLVEQGGLSNKTQLVELARRCISIAVRCGISADAMYLASKQTGRLSQHVVEVSAFANILVLHVRDS